MTRTNDVEARIQRMQALLGRAVALDEDEYDYDDVAWYNFIADVKALLKEAEVKDGKH